MLPSIRPPSLANYCDAVATPWPVAGVPTLEGLLAARARLFRKMACPKSADNAVGNRREFIIDMKAVSTRESGCRAVSGGKSPWFPVPTCKLEVPLIIIGEVGDRGLRSAEVKSRREDDVIIRRCPVSGQDVREAVNIRLRIVRMSVCGIGGHEGTHHEELPQLPGEVLIRACGLGLCQIQMPVEGMVALHLLQES